MSFLALVLIHIFLVFFSFVICTVRWFISLIVTLNIQLCTCIFLFPPLKQSHELQVNEISLHLGSSAGMNPHSFPGCSLSLCHLPSMARLSCIATCFSGGKLLNPVLAKGDRAMDHVLPDHFPAAEPFWSTSAETTRVEWLLHELQMKCAGLNYPWRCFGSTSSSRLRFWDVLGSNHRKHPVHLQEQEQGQCHHSPATFQSS